MLRKSPTSNAWAAAFKNADFSYSSFKFTKFSNFFLLLKLFLSPLLKKWSLLLVLNLIKQRTEENKETKVNKNIEKTSA